MLEVNYSNYNTYSTDCLTQWDTNQTLKIKGLGLKAAPTVLFSNRVSVTNDPVTAILKDGFVICDIPNGLLTESYPITAYIRTTVNGATTTICKIKIPIIPGLKPDDYVYIENISIISYETLVGKINSKVDISVYEAKVSTIETTISEILENGTTQEQINNSVENWITQAIADGTIAAMTIEDGSVTPQKTSFLSGGRVNLLNNVTIHDGGYISGYDTSTKSLNIATSNIYSYTDKIAVDGGVKYLLNPNGTHSVNIQTVIYIDIFGGYTSEKLPVGTTEITTPQGCKYMYMDMLTAYKDVEYLYKDGSNEIIATDLVTDGAKILDGSIGIEKFSFRKRKSVDLLDGFVVDENTQFGYIKNDGTINVVNPTFRPSDVVTPFLPVIGGKTYVRNKFTRNTSTIQYIDMFDADKNLIKVVKIDENALQFTIPDGVSFVRITSRNTDLPYDFIVPIDSYDAEDSAFTDPGINLIANPSGYTEKATIGNNGNITSNEIARDVVSDFIPVKPGGKYYKNISFYYGMYKRYVAMYDADKNYIGVVYMPALGAKGSTLDGSFTVSDNAHYIKIMIDPPSTTRGDYLVSEEDYPKILDIKTRYTTYELEGFTAGSGSSGNAVNREVTLPRLDFYGNPDLMTTAKNEVEFRYTFNEGEDKPIRYGFAKVKLQGNSSLGYPKKNYTVKFYNDAKFKSKDDVDLGLNFVNSKYVTKANWVDHSHARNIVSARLWSRIVKMRSHVPDGLKASPNYGAVDGYPITIYFNDVYNGLYTLNIPKDDFTYGLDKSNPLHCAICGNWNNNGNTSTTSAVEFRVVGTEGWDNEVPEVWNNDTTNGLKNLIKFVMESTDDEFRAGLDHYLDVESAIDYYLFVYFVCAIDSLGKNIILVTYDAVKWYMCAYDLDSTFGLFWNGSKFQDADLKCPEQYQETNSLLFQRIEKCFARELKERYDLLRSTVLNVENVHREFDRFMSLIPNKEYRADADKWPGVPQGNTDLNTQIKKFVEDRSIYVDGEISAMLVPCTSLTMGESGSTLTVGSTLTLTATKDANTTDMIDWSTSDKAIATVDYNGVVTGVAPGTVVITAKCGEKTATREITVS